MIILHDRFWIVWQVCITTYLLIPQVTTQECEKDNPNTPRLFMTMFQGPIASMANKSGFIESLGDCYGVDTLVERMLAYFEPYGLDLDPIKMDPFQLYEDSNFRFLPSNHNSGSPYRVLRDVFYEYAIVTDFPVDYANWVLIAKRTVVGPRGTFMPGDWATFGLIR